MRVIAGEAGGRRLKAPPGESTRPTSDAVREALFSAVASRLEIQGARVLDLFAGSGALGIEALSRGARHVTFIDKDRDAADTIEANLDSLGIDGGRVVRSAVQSFLDARTADEVWDLVLADPPYAFDGWQSLLDSLRCRVAEDGLVVIESGHEVAVPKGWRSVREKRYGTTVVSLVVPCHHPCAESS